VDTDQGDRPLMPLSIDLASLRPLPMKVSAQYDVNYGRLQTITSDISLPFKRGSVSVGQRYNRVEDILEFKAGFTVKPVRAIEMGMDVWYDAKGEGLTNLTARLNYLSQCWGMRIEAAKRSGDFTLTVMFDLFGMTARAPKKQQS